MNTINQTNSTLHLCIATGQNAANFIPLKQLNAQEVWILETPEMKKQHSGANLKLALKHHVENIQCLDFDDSTPQAITYAAAKLASDKLDGRDVVFHITGGTKLMVLAIHNELTLLNSGTGKYRTLYTDTKKQTLAWMETLSQENMTDVLTLNDALLINGYHITNDIRPAKDQQRAAARSKVSRFMAENVSLPYYKKERKIAELALEHNLPIENNRQFYDGGWLEEYVFLKIQGMQLKPTQYAMNVKVNQKHSDTHNEIDAMVVKNNRVLLIECKSGKQIDAQDAIYKLGQVVKQVGGSMAQGLYVSAKPLTEGDSRRAKEYNIKVIQEDDLPNLSNYLRDWAK
jgi:hypothetical protein